MTLFISNSTIMIQTVRTCLLLALGCVLFIPMGYAQDIEAQLARLDDGIKHARSENLHLIAPKAYEQSTEYLKQAQKKMREGGNLSEIQEALNRGQQKLLNGQEFNDIGEVILKDAFTARTAALDARAPEFAKEKWLDAEKMTRSAGREIEKGDQNDARQDAKKAAGIYREAELKAIRSNLLGTARQYRSAAKEADADEWARNTWTSADTKLKKADKILETDRYDRAESRTLAEEAAMQFEHARRLTVAAKRIDDDVEKNAETEILRYETGMTSLAKTLGTEVSFGNGLDAVTERLMASIESMKTDRGNLEEHLQNRDRRIARLKHSVDSLNARLAGLNAREELVSGELQDQRERDRTLNRIRSVFNEEEAEVRTSGDHVIVRMLGLNFESGSSEIQPKSFNLLTKAQRVLRELPDGKITITGHTDALGNDAGNMTLSEKRAEAVRQYLLANMDLAPERIVAIGRGESEPIASNETEDGRAKNRRIDVSIGYR